MWAEGALDGAPRDTVSNRHKDAQEGAFEVARNGTLWSGSVVALVDAIINEKICTKWLR